LVEGVQAIKRKKGKKEKRKKGKKEKRQDGSPELYRQGFYLDLFLNLMLR